MSDAIKVIGQLACAATTEETVQVFLIEMQWVSSAPTDDV